MNVVWDSRHFQRDLRRGSSANNHEWVQDDAAADAASLF